MDISKKKGILYLIPSSIGISEMSMTLPMDVIQIILKLDIFIVEEIKTARRFLRKAGYKKDFDLVKFLIFNEHTDSNDLRIFFEDLENGKHLGLLSEAGIPCVADPGSVIVSNAHNRDIKVIPLTGPSSIFLALMASGFNGQKFAFHGYLPIKKEERIRKIKQLERNIRSDNQTQIFIETPYRNIQLMKALVETCNNETLCCIASNITQDNELIMTKSIAEWCQDLPDIHKKPTVFLLYRE